MKRALAALLALLTGASAQAADPLPRLRILPGSLTVSGFSAGGYMATQYQVAYSKDVIGAGIVAAGPWFCAQASLWRAREHCLAGSAAGPEIGPLAAVLESSARLKAIDDPSWLAPDRVWIFHGTKDRTVGAAVVDSLLRFYHRYLPPERIQYETQVAAAHVFPTDAGNGACAVAESPWTGNCGYDAAGAMLNHLYDGLRRPSGALAGEIRRFDQSRYAQDGMLTSLAAEGYVFVPQECAAGKPCRLHVAFHGCRQGASFVGRSFVRDAGYNRWAAANRIVVLYPQAARSIVWPFNPRGCWDWWGYSGADYATRNGTQLSSVHRMIAALGG